MLAFRVDIPEHADSQLLEAAGLSATLRMRMRHLAAFGQTSVDSNREMVVSVYNLIEHRDDDETNTNSTDERQLVTSRVLTKRDRRKRWGEFNVSSAVDRLLAGNVGSRREKLLRLSVTVSDGANTSYSVFGEIRCADGPINTDVQHGLRHGPVLNVLFTDRSVLHFFNVPLAV